jgi:hypothetical protein
VSRDDRSWLDGDKLTFSERDQLRKRPGESRERQPRSPAARERAEAATKQYLKEIDGVFSKGGVSAEAERLARAMRDAHGTPGLADACRAYRDALGIPEDASLLSLFLDTGDPELVLCGLEALRSAHEGGELALTSGLRSQLRMLAQDSDDAVAESAEELLEKV